MEYTLNLNSEIPEDIHERMPGRENKEDYQGHIYHLTFEDADMEREPFTNVFEKFDEREEFSFDGQNPVEALNDQIEHRDRDPTDWQSYNSGNEVYIETETPGAKGVLWSEYGPLSALRDEAVFSAPASVYVDITGEDVVDSIAGITEQTDAPYLESDPDVVKDETSGDVFTGGFTVPATYTDAELEESIDAWVDRVSKVSELQEDIREVMGRHP